MPKQKAKGDAPVKPKPPTDPNRKANMKRAWALVKSGEAANIGEALKLVYDKE